MCGKLYFDLDSEQSKLRFIELHWELTPSVVSCILIFFISKSYPAKWVGLG